MNNRAAMVEHLLLKMLYKSTPISIGSNLLLALLTSAVFIENNALYQLGVWLVMHLMVGAARLVYYLKFARLERPDQNQKYYRAQLILIGLQSLLWASAPWLVFTQADIFQKTFYGFMVAGLTSGAVSTLSADRLTFFVYEAVTLSSISLWFFTGGTLPEYIMGFMTAFYFFFLVMSSKQIHSAMINAIRLRNENIETKRQLSDNKQQLELLFHHVPAGIFFYDPYLKIIDANDTFCTLLQIDREQLIGLEMLNLADQRVMPALQSPLQAAENGFYEGPYITSLTNQLINIRLLTSPVTDEKEKCIGGIGILENISREVEQKEQLKSFASFYTQNPNPVFQINCARKTILAENALAKRLRNELPHDTWNDFLHQVCVKRTQPIEIRSGSTLYQFDAVKPEIDRLNLYGRDITLERAAQERADYLAYYDELTGLPRRELFFEHVKVAIQRSLRMQTYNALLFLDLDNFKQINDTMGHNIGDELLIQLADRLKSSIRGNDVISRLGGDEFVILVGDLDPSSAKASQQAHQMSENVRQSVAVPFRIGTRELHFTASIGITLFNGPREMFDLLKEADAAMYEAKNGGKNATRLYDNTLQNFTVERNELMQDLHKAIEHGELELHYQAQIDLENNTCRGAEALLRWHHPKKGMVPPDVFIELAEESGRIHEIGSWVIKKASEDSKDFAQLEYISVNVSVKEFLRSDYVQTLSDMADAGVIDPRRLELEITESMIISNFDEINRKLRSLSELGFRLSIDDFGSGYSSLSYLKNLTINTLKIDRSFVKDIGIDENDEVLSRTIIDIAKHFGMKTIAEGVENQEQLDFLQQYGCDMIQGYFISRPIDKAHFVAWLAEREQRIEQGVNP